MAKIEDEETGEVTEIPAVKKKVEPTVVIDLVCPDCGCDHWTPLSQLRFVRSFAGNRIQVTWPHNTPEGHNYGMVACPNCGLIGMVTKEGNIDKLPPKWFAVSKEE